MKTCKMWLKKKLKIKLEIIQIVQWIKNTIHAKMKIINRGKQIKNNQVVLILNQEILID